MRNYGSKCECVGQIAESLDAARVRRASRTPAKKLLRKAGQAEVQTGRRVSPATNRTHVCSCPQVSSERFKRQRSVWPHPAISLPNYAAPVIDPKCVWVEFQPFTRSNEINRFGLRAFFAETDDRVLVTVPGVEFKDFNMKPWCVGVTTAQIANLFKDWQSLRNPRDARRFRGDVRYVYTFARFKFRG